MNESIKAAFDALEGLGDVIYKGYADDRTLTELWGWQALPLNRADLSIMAYELATMLREYKGTKIEENVEASLKLIPERINIFRTSVFPQFYSGHAVQCGPIYISLIDWATTVIRPLFSWSHLQDTKALPKNLISRLNIIQSELAELMPSKEEVDAKLKLINSTAAAAESLPDDIDKITEDKIKIEKIFSNVKSFGEKVESLHNDLTEISNQIKIKNEEASTLISKSEEAYNITTTKGLAGAFNVRSRSLVRSMYTWVGILGIALSCAVYFGKERFDSINAALNNEKLATGNIIAHILLAVLGLGAPVWLAWIATKQISQRFKLMEDYGYKATVAKAYEGYRREASKMDPALSERLFSSLLSRLEETPLHLIDGKQYNSPLHELIDSAEFKKAMRQVPDFQEKMLNSIRNIFKKSSTGGDSAQTPSE